jgi:hypothetical protein
MIHPFHAQIGCLVPTKAAGKKLPEKWFGSKMKHPHFGNIQPVQNLGYDEILHSMPFKGAALRALHVQPSSRKTRQVPKWPLIMADRAFKLGFSPVQRFIQPDWRPNFLFYLLNQVAHLEPGPGKIRDFF